MGYEICYIDNELIIDKEAVKVSVNKVLSTVEDLLHEEQTALTIILRKYGKEANEYVFFFSFFPLTKVSFSAISYHGC